MSNPLGAILAGIGAGASSAGNSLTEEAILAAQNKRQAALDAIARQQKLSELGLTPTDSSDPGQAQNLSPVQQVAMAAQSPQDVVAAGKQMQPSDYALKQLVALPTATGGIQQYTQGEPMAEQLADRRAADQEARQEKFLTAQKAASAVDPDVLADALNPASPTKIKSQAQVLVKQPALQTTFDAVNKPAPVRNIDPLSPEGIRADAKKAGAVKAAEVAAAGPKPLAPAEVDKQEQLGQLLPLMKSDHGILGTTPDYTKSNPPEPDAGTAAKTPGRTQQTLSRIPLQIGTNANTQAYNAAANDWMLQYSQSLRTRGITPPTIEILRQTFIPSGAESGNPTIVQQKAKRREQAMEQIRVRAGLPAPTGAGAFTDLIPKKNDDE